MPPAIGTVVVAAVVTVVAVIVVFTGVAAGSRWTFEILAGMGVVVGLLAAFGVLDRSPTGRARIRATGGAADDELGRRVHDHLAALDPVEHRRLELGDPWPTVVVGPTGVDVITIAPTVDVGAIGRLGSVVATVRDVLDGLDLEVTGSLIVPEGCAGTDRVGRVRVVAIDHLGEVLASGRLVTMPVVADAFRRLSGSIAPDLPSTAAG